jgi:hypothetical protein
LFNSRISLLIFCLDVLSVDKTLVLMFSNIIVSRLITFFVLRSVCFMNLGMLVQHTWGFLSDSRRDVKVEPGSNSSSWSFPRRCSYCHKIKTPYKTWWIVELKLGELKMFVYKSTTRFQLT